MNYYLAIEAGYLAETYEPRHDIPTIRHFDK